MMFYYAASMSHCLQSFRTVVARASDSYTAAMEMYSVSQTIDVIESQTFSDIEVSAQMRSGIVCVNIYRAKNDSTQALTKNNAPSVIGKIKQEYWPSHNYVQYIGTQNGAWLLMSVNKKGEVAIYHQHVQGSLQWTYFEGSLSYPIA